MKAIIAKFVRVRGQRWAEIRDDGRLVYEFECEDETRKALEAHAAQLREQANALLYKAKCIEEAAYRIL